MQHPHHIIALTEVCAITRIPLRTLQNITKRLSLNHLRFQRKIFFDLSYDHPFHRSLKIALQYRINPIFSIPQCGRFWHMSEKTAKKTLEQLNIPIYHCPTKGFVYLCDILAIRKPQ